SVQASIKEFGFNMVASDMISLDRSVNDLRQEELPTVPYIAVPITLPVSQKRSIKVNVVCSKGNCECACIHLRTHTVLISSLLFFHVHCQSFPFFKHSMMIPVIHCLFHLLFRSPVMAGGLFAVNRKWFWELGGYDPGLEIWGGEQYEISFKVWMCGGGMFDVPCSRVGHIYRKYVPYKVPSGTSLARNLKRVAETWMDEFAEYIYQRRPEYRHLSTGDISAQKELRKHLKCKDFKWFMAAVAWDVPKYYPPVEPPPAAWGEIRNVAANLCVDSKHGATGTELRLDICVKDGSERTWSHEQLFTFGWREDIRPGEPLHTRKFCFDAISHSSPVTLYDCHGMKGNQHWSYRKDKTLFHPVSSSCIDCNPSEKKIFMNRCDPLSETQQWVFEHINMTVLEKFNSNASS
uniref:polypeptide N-acetylgalactosaminyltransferase n=1 Tax=Meleagris gallopavo TaxID=9103 RepID=A0A803XVK0_MELGA